MSTGNWVTINGVHVLIGANGKITKGPAKFIGSTVEDLPGSKATGKYAKKSAEKKSTTKKEAPKKTTTKKTTPKNAGQTMSTVESRGNSKMPKATKGRTTNSNSDIQKLLKGGKEKYAYTDSELKKLANAHKNGDAKLKKQIEDRLTDINYHTEASSFKFGDYTTISGKKLQVAPVGRFQPVSGASVLFGEARMGYAVRRTRTGTPRTSTRVNRLGR